MDKSKCAGLIDDILKATEFITVVTSGERGPYLVGNWGAHQRILGREGDTIFLPVRGYWQTEKNLRRNDRIAMMAASRHIQHARGGQGCVLYGRGEIVTSGPIAEIVKTKFPWARGALLIHVEEAATQHT
jgi:hypothetical protein